jgi:flavin-dependent dehydrogenase
VAAPIDAEVGVIGGGPAGSAFANRMARLGHSVLLIERCAFPRPHIGEGVSPGLMPLIEMLGLQSTSEALGLRQTSTALVNWEQPDRVELNKLSWSVDRAAFDLRLLDSAREVGVRVLQPATVLSPPERTGTGWKMRVATTDAKRVIRCRFIADASGRSFASGGHRLRSVIRTIAIHACWRLRDVPRLDSAVTTGRQGWCWASMLPNHQLRVMAFVDANWLRSHGVIKANLQRYYLDLIGETGILNGFPPADLCGRAEACDASTYQDSDPIGDDYIRVGEACFAIDPLSSSGIQVAVQSALAGSVATHTTLAFPQDRAAALSFYRQHQDHAFNQHRQRAAEFYALHRPNRRAPFWRARAGAASMQADPARGKSSVLPAGPIRLCAGASIVDHPCAVGDRVRLRRAISHPRLNRPVAYLDGFELEPLLPDLDGSSTASDLVATWSSAVGRSAAEKIVRWLCHTGIAEPTLDGAS